MAMPVLPESSTLHLFAQGAWDFLLAAAALSAVVALICAAADDFLRPLAHGLHVQRRVHTHGKKSSALTGDWIGGPLGCGGTPCSREEVAGLELRVTSRPGWSFAELREQRPADPRRVEPPFLSRRTPSVDPDRLRRHLRLTGSSLGGAHVCFAR
jgi:hypothetical protein